MNFDLRELNLPKKEDYTNFAYFYDAIKLFSLSYKTLSRENILINFLYFDYKNISNTESYIFRVNFLYFYFEYIELKISFNSFQTLYDNENISNTILNLGIEYEIDKTTTFYHYFFKIEIVKYEDYYHIKITNEFKQTFEKREVDKLAFYQYFNQFGFISQIHPTNTYFGDDGYPIEFDSEYKIVISLNHQKTSFFYFTQHGLTFGEYRKIYDRVNAETTLVYIYKVDLKIITPTKIYLYNSKEFFDNYRVLEFENFTLFIYEYGVICIDKINFFKQIYSNLDYLNFLNKSIETVFKLPSTINSINYKNSLISLSLKGAKFQDNQIVKVNNFDEDFKVMLSFLAYSSNQKEIFYFLQSDTTFLISKEEFLNGWIWSFWSIFN